MIIKPSAGIKLFILPVSVFLVIIAGIFYVKPTFDDIVKAKQAIKESQGQLEKISDENGTLSLVKESMASMAKEKDLVQVALPEKESADYYISELYSRANRNGVLLTKVTVPEGKGNQCLGQKGAEAASFPEEEGSGKSASNEEQNVLPAQSISSCLFSSMVEFSFKGNWEQLLSFLKSINDMNRISSIKKIGIVSTVQKNEAGEEVSDLLSVVVSADVYFKNATKEVSRSAIANLADQGEFSEKSIEKITSAVRYQFNLPIVSESGERNIFK